MNYLNELYGHKWSQACKMLFQLALKQKKKMDTVDYYINNLRRIQIEKRVDFLINYELPHDKTELITFQNRLKKHRSFLLTFLYRPEVPPDNNASERAIRNIKVKQKVSGQFKSPSGAFGFAVLRSVTDTILKNNQNILGSLKVIANLHTD